MYNANPWIAALLALLLSACGTSPTGGESAQTVALLPVWPGAPAEPRIRFVRSISTARDLGIAPHFFRRLMNTITGKSDHYFVRPTGVAERDGVVYVADMGAQVLWILDPANDSSVEVRKVGATTLVSPAAVAVRDDGAVYVADAWAKKVFLVDRHGKFLGVAAKTGLQRPAGLAYDRNNGRLYVADSAAHKIVAFAPDGRQILSWGRRGAGDGEFNYPTHLSIDPLGRVLVTDELNFRIQAFDRDGKFLWKFGRHGDGSGDFSAPKGVAADSGGHVYVVDALFDSVQIFNPDGTLLLAFGAQGTGKGQFWLPGGIYIDDKDRIYVADAYNQRIQVFDFIGGVAPATANNRP